MVTTLQSFAKEIPRPKAIVVISAHWEASIPTITATETPELIYDYYGFPDETYRITYPCPGNPNLATDIQQCLYDADISSELNTQRGFDHGLFVPLKIMHPEADIPCVQVSLMDNLNPARHIQVGTALANLNVDELLILGSGFSFHNMWAFFNSTTPDQNNQDFEQWLIETCTSQHLTEEQRAQRLIN
jgi:4,5-DOPA dioxygenase extradiol